MNKVVQSHFPEFLTIWIFLDFDSNISFHFRDFFYFSANLFVKFILWQHLPIS